MGISLISLENEVECYLVCPKRAEANFVHKIRPTLLKEELVFWRLSFSTKIKSIWQPVHLSTLRWLGILTFSLIVDITLALGVDVALTLTHKKKKKKKESWLIFQYLNNTSITVHKTLCKQSTMTHSQHHFQTIKALINDAFFFETSFILCLECNWYQNLLLVYNKTLLSLWVL